MANTQGPWGFRPLRNINFGAPTYGMNAYQIAYNNTNKIAKGDPVLLNTSGQIDILAPGTTAIFGIFWGCKYINPSVPSASPWYNAWLAPSGLPSTTLVECYIMDDPTEVYECQAGQSSTVAVAQADIGANCQFANQGLPNTAGFSVAYLSAINTTNTLPFRIVGLGQGIGNDNASAYNTVQVIMNFNQRNVNLGV